MSENKERAIAAQTQEKFDFYLLSLVFTLLALSVQTAKFGGLPHIDMLEVVGWLAFLASGLAGLSRLEQIPHIRTVLATQQEFETDRMHLTKEVLEGRGDARIHVVHDQIEQTVAQRLAHRQHGLSKLAPAIEELQRRSQAKWAAHKYSFILGVVCIIVARGFEPLELIIKAIFTP